MTVDRHGRRRIAEIERDRAGMGLAGVAVVVRIAVRNFSRTGRQAVMRRKTGLAHRSGRRRHGRQMIDGIDVDDELAGAEFDAVAVVIGDRDELREVDAAQRSAIDLVEQVEGGVAVGRQRQREDGGAAGNAGDGVTIRRHRDLRAVVGQRTDVLGAAERSQTPGAGGIGAHRDQRRQVDDGFGRMQRRRGGLGHRKIVDDDAAVEIRCRRIDLEFGNRQIAESRECGGRLLADIAKRGRVEGRASDQIPGRIIRLQGQRVCSRFRKCRAGRCSA